ncbi:HNH endonuclease [uncultured Alistipes sp.]|uniref:HNH endonuclease n=1 Tax=Bacteroidales TaxID=171549 RepID=UPI00338E70F4
MQCIFCHKDASWPTNVEHIVPESLGNKDMCLPKGYVCDECNHHLAIKAEKDPPFRYSIFFHIFMANIIRTRYPHP